MTTSLKAILLCLFLLPCGCAHISYKHGEFDVWTLFKDYDLRGLLINTNGLAIGGLIGNTDNEAISSAAEGAAKGIVP